MENKKKEYVKPELEIHKFKKFFYFCLCSAAVLDPVCDGSGATPLVTSIDAPGTCLS